MSFAEMREITADWSKRLDVKAINDNARVVELSGGNQQKVVIGKGLAVVLISSYLPEVMNLSDRILVCRQGRVVEEISPA